MAKRLNDGEERVMKVAVWGNKDVAVKAIRIDSDTPIIELKFSSGELVNLSDGEADELVDRLRLALAILPTSK